MATYVRALAAALARTRHDVLVVHGESNLPASTEPGYRVAAVPDALVATAARDRTLASQVIAALDRFSPDLVHIQSNNNFPLEDAIAADRPVVKTMHVHDYCPAGTKYHFGPERACAVRTGVMCVPRMGYLRCTLSRRPLVIWRFYRHTTAANSHHTRLRQLVVCSEHVKSQAVFTGFDPDRIAVVPYFTGMPASTPAPARTRTIFALGRLVRAKGFDLLLESLAQVSGDWRAVIAGDGPERAQLERRAGDLGLGHLVQFPGWLTGEALEDAYARAEIVAVPSRWPEPFGIVGLEAMAHARAVAAFKVGGIPEWLQEGIGGVLVEPLQTRALAERISWLLDHPDEAGRMAARGRERVAREFSADAHLARLIPIYERLVA